MTRKATTSSGRNQKFSGKVQEILEVKKKFFSAILIYDPLNDFANPMGANRIM